MLTSPIMNTNACNCEALNKKNTEKKPFSVVVLLHVNISSCFKTAT